MTDPTLRTVLRRRVLAPTAVAFDGTAVPNAGPAAYVTGLSSRGAPV